MSDAPFPSARPLGATPGRVWRTVRHLAPAQLAWRVRALLLERAERVVPSLAAIDAPAAALAPRALVRPAALHLPPPADDAVLADFAAGRIVVLGRAIAFGGGDDWWLPEVAGIGRLFQFHVHYHDWLVPLAVRAGAGDAAALAHVVRLLGDWLACCRPDGPRALRNAWHPYVIATRLGAWGRILAAAPAVAAHDGGALGRSIATSVARQARRLAARLERDLRANHLLRDATGLAWAAHLLDDVAGARTARLAAALARGELREQVLADGGHVERSPAYHVHAMHDVLDLALLLRDADAAREARVALDAMDDWLAAVLHPDGDVPLLNDAVLQGAHELAVLRDDVAACLGRARRAGDDGLRHLAASGLVVHRDAHATTIVDVGEVGPDWQPGHAHADTLTLECSVRGVRCLVDPGTYGYAADASRVHDRATRSHNCATLDDADSTEVWGTFRVGARARPVDVRLEAGAVPGVRAGHDGLRPATVHRTVRWPAGAMEVVDELCPAVAATATGGWLVGPGWTVEATGPLAFRLRHPAAGTVALRLEGAPGLVAGTAGACYHPRIGVRDSATRIGWRVSAPAGTVCRVVSRFDFSA